MEYINEKEFTILDVLYESIFNDIIIMLCKYNNDIYVYKKYIKNDIDNIKKIESLTNKNDEYLLFPKKIVKSDNKINGFLQKYVDGKDLYSLLNANMNIKIEVLKEAKKQIERLHNNYNIIHGDLHAANILIKNNKSYIIDFDNCNIGKFKINRKNCLDMVKQYIKKIGINESLDIFTFNITTYAILYNCPFQMVRNNIRQENYGYFDNPNCRTICKRLLLDNNDINDKYLIDHIKK